MVANGNFIPVPRFRKPRRRSDSRPCLDCGTELLPHLDADPNGDLASRCAKCKAEYRHDFDAEPDVQFTRSGMGRNFSNTVPGC
jgi:hypothetical protein